MFNFSLFLLLFVTILLQHTTHGGILQSNAHTHKLSKEREEDGAYSPRDRKHFEDGAHHAEFDHEAIIGSHREAEEYDHLPPAEAKRRLEVLLKLMDLNKDQSINKQELKAWILRSFKMLSKEEANESFEEADEDGNGVVSWQEYLVETYGLESGDINDIEDKQLIGDDELMWRAADKNNDNQLDIDEWLAFSHPEESSDMIPLILAQTLRDKDKDGDGSISFQEYVGDKGKENDKEWLHVEKDKFDHELDKNGDGKLSGNEILSWTVPDNGDIAEEEVDHLFASSDIDHDELISFKEALDNHESFVGSEATDYGDHLHNIHQFNDEL